MNSGPHERRGGRGVRVMALMTSIVTMPEGQSAQHDPRRRQRLQADLDEDERVAPDEGEQQVRRAARRVATTSRALAREQRLLDGQPPAVARQAAVRPDDAVARDRQRDGVRRARAGDGAHGRRPADRRGHLGVRARLARRGSRAARSTPGPGTPCRARRPAGRGRAAPRGQRPQRSHHVGHGRVVPLSIACGNSARISRTRSPLAPDPHSRQPTRRRDRDDVTDSGARHRPQQHLLRRAGDVVRGGHAESPGRLLVEAAHGAVPRGEGRIEDRVRDRRADAVRSVRTAWPNCRGVTPSTSAKSRCNWRALQCRRSRELGTGSGPPAASWHRRRP